VAPIGHLAVGPASGVPKAGVRLHHRCIGTQLRRNVRGGPGPGTTSVEKNLRRITVAQAQQGRSGSPLRLSAAGERKSRAERLIRSGQHSEG